ncbi:MAG TPA: hypothetical protein VEW93_12375 [Acidimicrobiales bacterium]|nr:hypothetical protein [Acidimicrobiales bacterium]
MTAPPSLAPATDPWRAVPGQEAAVAQLRAATADPVHAYLFLGPPGSGKEQAARVFAGEVLAATSATAEEADRHRDLAGSEGHPDVVVVRREGASITVAQAVEIVRLSSLKPVEGSRKVLVLDEFHLVADTAAGKLLKTVEEPPGGTVFVVLADEVPDELVTIASRCVRVPFPALGDDVVAAVLEGDGVEPAQAALLAAAAHGDVDRARLLAGDERFALRMEQWRAVPSRIDGTGATVAAVVDELRAALDDAARPLEARQVVEVADLTARIERYGQRGSGARELEARHKRQLRRLRADELRMGLAELAHHYRDRLVGAALADGHEHPGAERVHVEEAGGALAALRDAGEALLRNPNEELLLQALLLRLPPGR